MRCWSAVLEMTLVCYDGYMPDSKKMRVLFVTSEVATIFKLGGLADVSHALPVALAKIGVTVDIALPYYPAIKVSDPKCLGAIAVSFAGKRELVFIFSYHLPKTRVRLLLFRHPFLEYQPRVDTHLPNRFAFFCQAVATFLLGAMAAQRPYDIIHCNDWHTGLVPGLVGESLKLRNKHHISPAHSSWHEAFWPISRAQVKLFQRKGSLQETVFKSPPKLMALESEVHTLVTIHNPIYHGVLRADGIDALGVDPRFFAIHAAKQERYVIMLEEGIRHADIVTTVSPTFAKEMLTVDYGPHISGILEQRQDRITGILNGIDHEIWNPGTDLFLSVNYTKSTVIAGKKAAKAYLTSALHLDVSNGEVLFGFVGRLDPRQKGIDILLEAIVAAWKHTDAARFVLLGTGGEKITKEITKLAEKYPGLISFVPTFDERLARRIYAGSDVMLVPSKFEPCGLTQMIAMRYGTLPLVRKTGGLADSVKDGKNGFVFGRYSAVTLAQRMGEVIDVYERDQKLWQRMIRMAMATDLSWTRSAKEYKKLYEKLLG